MEDGDLKELPSFSCRRKERNFINEVDSKVLFKGGK
jgi:hypothetical protein